VTARRRGDATSAPAAGPVADADPPTASGGGPLRPSAPPPAGAGDSTPVDPLADDSSDETSPTEVGADDLGGVATSSQDVGDGDAVDSEELADEIDELAMLAAERDSFRELAQRIQADFENYRKRVQGQLRDEADRASGRLAEALLPVLDATEAAYVRHPDEVGPLLNVMLGELRKHGLEALDLEGQPFDPNLADAVAHEPGEGDEIVVAEVLRSGYRWKDRTLRPAMVRTAAADEAADVDAAADTAGTAGADGS